MVVFKKDIAVDLIKKGFHLIKVSPSDRDKNKFVFIFSNSKEIEDEINGYINNKA